MELCEPYCEKYSIPVPINYITEFEQLSYSDLNSLYQKMRQLVRKYNGKEILNELSINKNKTWNLNKEGVKFKNIKPGDIIVFNLYDTNPPTLAKQVVTKINGVSQLQSHDLGNEKAIDFWHTGDIENYWKKNVENLNELSINNPANITPEKVYKYWEYNIQNNDDEFATHNKGWQEYKNLKEKFGYSYLLTHDIIYQLSQKDLNKFYNEIRQLVRKYVVS